MCRHSYSDMAGKNVANPTAMLLCAANFLEYAGLGSHGDRIRGAVQRVLKDGRVRTKDLVRTRETLKEITLN